MFSSFPELPFALFLVLQPGPCAAIYNFSLLSSLLLPVLEVSFFLKFFVFSFFPPGVSTFSVNSFFLLGRPPHQVSPLSRSPTRPLPPRLEVSCFDTPLNQELFNFFHNLLLPDFLARLFSSLRFVAFLLPRFPH